MLLLKVFLQYFNWQCWFD